MSVNAGAEHADVGRLLASLRALLAGWQEQAQLAARNRDLAGRGSPERVMWDAEAQTLTECWSGLATTLATHAPVTPANGT